MINAGRVLDADVLGAMDVDAGQHRIQSARATAWYLVGHFVVSEDVHAETLSDRKGPRVKRLTAPFWDALKGGFDHD